MIDTHCHLTYPGLIERAPEVIAAAQAAGVQRMISVGTSPDDARKALELAKRYDCVRVAAGLHPHHAPAPGCDSMLTELRELLAHPKVVALGEMGLDWHYPDPPRDQQRAAFAAQLALMHDGWSGPGVIHNREATDDTLAMIREAGTPGERFVFHCFTGTRDELDAILDLGAMVSFTGIVTFKNAADLAEASDRVPLDRLMIETDSPYLTPIPHRKVKINEPRYVVHVAEFLAARRNMSVQDFTAAVDANAVRFFGL
ncbi:MAG: TatD family hydrolase [Phycisphaeraceae bacterium]|nr:TatD family hydrolase [Phycisphaeraceae bacterium]